MTMINSDIENRIKARHSSSLFVTFLKAESRLFFGLLVDLSDSGFRLNTGEKIDLMKHFELAVQNPFSKNEDDFNFFTAESIWCKENNDGLFEAGFKLINYDDTCDKVFKNILADFESSNNSI